MTRESRELYQSDDEVMVGTYRDLATGRLVHIRHDRDLLPPPEQGGIATYEWITEDPDWEEDQSGEPHQP
jgi:hypothetical protein